MLMSFRVYVANEGGLRNPEMPLVMRGRTMAVRPAPPTDLKLTPAQVRKFMVGLIDPLLMKRSFKILKRSSR